MTTPPLLSVIIPCHNGAATLGACLEALQAAAQPPLPAATQCPDQVWPLGPHGFEVVVVDDASTDDTAAIGERYPCRLLKLPSQRGASAARNIGAAAARGKILFFIDADCLVEPTTLQTVIAVADRHGRQWIIGGTYSLTPADRFFCSRWQAAFIHHFESKRQRPDYIATHAMIIHAATFAASGGFPEDFLPIIEDVEFSHRLRRQGLALAMEPSLQVRHVFHYTPRRWLANAWRKSRYWTIYSLSQQDLLSDSGTASHELKLNVAVLATTALLLLLWMVLGWLRPEWPAAYTLWLAAALVLLIGGNLWWQRRLLATFRRAGGWGFALAAGACYLLLYPWPVGLGGLAGLATFYLKGGQLPAGVPRRP
ncbi:MAG: glycosyltransferase [Desulfurivibrio sp.]|nr:glycosyltransferase [Desulfurivibrio sp.]